MNVPISAQRVRELMKTPPVTFTKPPKERFHLKRHYGPDKVKLVAGLKAQGFSTRQIQERTAIPQGTVWHLLRRAERNSTTP